ncbi:MAG: hypothetical protein M3Q07_04865, partial [Pseudobdellovibrionaceae bacterium]|nr:hypothetical protein [Pseudobdellovibrionaceae bacterium]
MTENYAFSHQFDSLRKIIKYDDGNIIQIYLRLVMIELYLKNALYSQDNAAFFQNHSRYHHHDLTNQINDLDPNFLNEESKIRALSEVSKILGFLRTPATYNFGQTNFKNPSYPWLRFYDVTVFGGQGVVFCKLDRQWEEFGAAIPVLVKVLKKTSVVSFNPHRGRDFSPSATESHDRQIGALKDLLFDEADLDEESSKYSEYDFDNWLQYWEYNEMFVNDLLPEITTSKKSSWSIVLDSILKYHDFEICEAGNLLSENNASGGKSKGILIRTQPIEQLLSRTQENLFIVGRKGTGKTKLLTYLATEQMGFALIVDDESDFGNKNSNSALLPSDGSRGFSASAAIFKDDLNSLTQSPDI